MQERFWSFFKDISAIPRESGNEAAVREYVLDFTQQQGLEALSDDCGNVLIRKPASSGYAEHEAVVLQGHLDMVCEKRSGVEHDFAKDRLDLLVDGDWLRADGTTLGADNGIAVAMGLAVLADPELAHPALEVLFTVDEETGLTGALGLKPDFIQARRLVNLDSEEEGYFYIGCAGGMHTSGKQELNTQAASQGTPALKLAVGGLCGGHSGLEIHKGLGNALKLAAGILDSYRGEYRLGCLQGGEKHNAIPRECSLVLQPDSVAAFEAHVREQERLLRSSFSDEKLLSISLDQQAKTKQFLTDSQSRSIIGLIKDLPHGVIGMDPQIEGLVQTSSNLAAVSYADGQLSVLTSQRSSDPQELKKIGDRVADVMTGYGLQTAHDSAYPAWKPDPDSALLLKALDVYRRHCNKEPRVEVVHAGLECGVIGEKYRDMQMISFGPDILGAHSPDERLGISSAERVWDYLCALLREL